MVKQADITCRGNQFCISGELDFSNVMIVYQKSLPYLKTGSALEFDFSELKSSNSAGLALVLEWMRYAKRHGKPIRFKHLSDDLMSIAKAGSIDGLIKACVTD